MKEIEYKFLLKNLPRAVIDNAEKVYIEQIYFNKTTNKKILSILNIPSSSLKEIDTVRIRIEHHKNSIKYILNAKTYGQKERLEFEKEIDEKNAKELLIKKYVGKIDKIRYKIPVKNYTFEFDEYLDKNKGLYVCEVEVNKKNDDYNFITEILHNKFELNFVDVTNDSKFKNVNLSKEFVYENYK